MSVWKGRKQLENLPRTADEIEFLPAHLELCEKPVSGLPKWSARAMITFLCLTVLWANFGKVDIVAVAQGKITTSSKSKNIQPLETAIVKQVYVKNGERVHKNQLLISLTTTGVDTDLFQSQETLIAMELSRLRLLALLEGIEQENKPILKKPSIVLPITKLKQEQELAINQYYAWKAQKQKLTAQIEQKQAEKQTILGNIDNLENILHYEKERNHDLYKLYKQKSASKHEYYQQKNKVLEIESNLITQKNRFNEIEKEIIQYQQEYHNFITSFKRDLLSELKHISNNLSLASLDKVKAEQRHAFMELRSPIDGVVQQLQTYTIGGVVTTGQSLMMIVPEEDKLEIEAVINNKDIGFIRAGQDVIIKAIAFPYTKYGYITGKVKNISLDAIQDEKLGFVFNTTISMDKNYLLIDDLPLYLKQGMLVSVEIKTGKQTVIDYFLSPLNSTINESLRER
ncbi:HlyD family type I secretion periplasmic adaptor subunit [Actinobacillus equuli]|nr:HlyD family type I secretion periplasmic adaptor subunit [Actinobacillus equuli]WGE44050.1 HlyD family type I secretion periplasmic adaptor subunit [Actinobacillus equuli subsp. equuli]